MKPSYIMDTIRMTRDAPEFVRLDNLRSVRLVQGELVEMPRKQSLILIRKGFATSGKCTHSHPCIFAIGREQCQGCSCDLSIFPHIYKWTRTDHQLWEYCE